MFKNFLARVLGSVITAISSAVSYTLDIQQIWNLEWKWLPLVLGSIAFGLLIWVIIDLYRQNDKILDARPLIEVEPIVENDICYLKVHNAGAEAIFKSLIQLDSKEDPSAQGISTYQGYWRLANKGEAKILKGHDDFLKLAEIQSSSTIASKNLKIWLFDASANYAHAFSTSSTWEGTITSPDGTTRPSGTPEYYFRVTISSSPEDRRGVFSRKYTLTVYGFSDSC